jgi:hypothetical protein
VVPVDGHLRILADQRVEEGHRTPAQQILLHKSLRVPIEVAERRAEGVTGDRPFHPFPRAAGLGVGQVFE